MISYTPATTQSSTVESTLAPLEAAQSLAPRRSWLAANVWTVFAAAIFLVSVPVFIQAPLVRLLPLISLVSTLGFWLAGRSLLKQQQTQVWGDLLLGFTWTWLAGSIYWGWLRWEPLLHLPVEAIGLPFAVWGILHNRGKVGNFFYLGSLFGTVVTDIFFYVVDLIPFWRKLMIASEASARPIFQAAIAQIQTSWGISWAIFLAMLLLVVSLLPLIRSQELYWWAFSGAVLSTILVDGLFWVAALVA